MSYTLIVMICGAQCAFPQVTLVGTFSSAAVCEVEKAALAKQLAASVPPVADPAAPAAPATPPYYWHLACVRKS